MAIVFERIQTPGIAQLSYLVGDDSRGTAAVVDPRPDVEAYLRIARENGLAITHVLETHIHADFMSGARSLVERLGGAELGGAELCVSGEGDAQYGFEATKIYDGDTFEFGSVTLTARHTPGHTPEHMAYVLSEEQRPWGVLTGDSLFVGSAGRPDLLGEEQTEELTRALFDTLRGFYLSLDDSVILYPCHGAGSACGADIGDRPMSTIGFERQTNEFLQIDQFEEFRKYVDEGAPPVPAHYKRLKKLNAAGPPVLLSAPAVRAAPPEAFRGEAEKRGVQLVDTRQMLAFGGGHIPGAMNIGARPELSVWAGEMLDAERPIALVVEEDCEVEPIVWLLVNTGFTNFSAYLAGGMKAWENAGFELQGLPQMPVHQLAERLEEVTPLDVRSPSERKSGRVPGAKPHYVADLREGLGDLESLPRDTPLAVYCGSGYRASIAASILQRSGFEAVSNVPGSWLAWRAADLPVEK